MNTEYRTRIIKKIVSLFLICLILSSCVSSKKSVPEPKVEEISSFAFNFVQSDNLKAVLEKARIEKKMVFVDVYTTWCLPCKMMDRYVFNDLKTAEIINMGFISYKVDAEKNNGPIVSFNYDVVEYPTLLFLDDEGNVLARKDGALSNSAFLLMAKEALEKSNGSD